MTEINLENMHKVHIIGIEGAGTSALARMLKETGKEVVGSDEGDHFYYDVLKEAEIKVFHKFDSKNIAEDVDLVIYSTSCKKDTNKELESAFKTGKPIIKYAEALGLVFNHKFGIAVCGTHGKTTTTAMLALAMKDTGADPTAIIGSKVRQFGSGSVVGKSEYFIIEADEYQNKLQYYDPIAVVLTSIDYDHPDYFETENDYKSVFEEFVRRIPNHGFLVAWAEDADVVKIAKEAKCKIILYGSFVDEFEENNLKEEFGRLNKDIKTIQAPNELKLKVPGQHNQLNATAVLAVSQKLGLDEKKIIESLNQYEGASRRMEFVGEYNGAEIIDDYAHHPVEVKATLRAARQMHPNKKITCIFHPHTFTRTKAFLSDFAQSFNDADRIIVLDIFGSAREKQGDVHSKDLVEKMKVYMKDVEYVPAIDKAYELLEKDLGKNDVLITMGAGDVWKLAEKLVTSNQ